ncbi:hypothetical protein [Cyclobacterium plantarum]|uniref:hypothetical protein n=1 Tax=Cyclobacterium plantarum TaxID=2716263 RepID=UPI003F719AAD
MDNVAAYFQGERQQCLIGAILSVLVIAMAVFFMFQEKPFLKGLAYATIPLALLLLVICVAVIVRVPKDIERVQALQYETAQGITTEEIPRMEKVMKNFLTIKRVELAIFLIGLVGMLVFWQNEWLRGLGLGLLIMGLCLFTFDYLAETRGESYLDFLKTMP